MEKIKYCTIISEKNKIGGNIMPIHELDGYKKNNDADIQSVIKALEGKGKASPAQIKNFISQCCSNKFVLKMIFEPNPTNPEKWEVTNYMTLMIPSANGTYREQLIEVPENFAKTVRETLGFPSPSKGPEESSANTSRMFK